LEVDYLLLADGAQLAGDKLYLLGGGWSVVNAGQLPTSIPVGLALGILVGWNETNQRHQFKVEILHEDSNETLYRMEGEFEQGRPPGIQPGSEQRFQLVSSHVLALKAAGQYVLRAYVNGHQLKRTAFIVIDRRTAQQPPQISPEDG